MTRGARFEGTGHRRRTAGSARFDPYYKIQYWQPRSCAWLDYQRQYETVEAAEAVAARLYPDTEWRLMYVTDAGRTLV